KQHVARGSTLTESYEHSGKVLDLQLRGEYLYAACGPDGFIAYDVANIANKGFSERIITAPVSPLGQRFYVNSKYATSICSPSTLAIDPTREHFAENKEQSVHLLYAFLYLTDAQEGLIVIGNPLDDKKNKPGLHIIDVERPEAPKLVQTYNADGKLNDSTAVRIGMTNSSMFAYVADGRNGLYVLQLSSPDDNPTYMGFSPRPEPRIVAHHK